MLYLALCCVEVEMMVRLYAPSLPRGTLGRPLRIAAVGAVVALLFAVPGLMLGLRGP